MNKHTLLFLVAVGMFIAFFGFMFSRETKVPQKSQPTAVVVSPLVENVPQKDDNGGNTTQTATTSSPDGVLIRTAVTFSFNDDEKGEKGQK